MKSHNLLYVFTATLLQTYFPLQCSFDVIFLHTLSITGKFFVNRQALSTGTYGSITSCLDTWSISVQLKFESVGAVKHISNNTTAKFKNLKQRTLQLKSSKYSYNQSDGSANKDLKINITYFLPTNGACYDVVKCYKKSTKSMTKHPNLIQETHINISYLIQ